MSFFLKNFTRPAATSAITRSFGLSSSTVHTTARRSMVSNSAGVKSAATMAAGPSTGGKVPPSGWQVFRKHWLSDSATYPIMMIIGAACTMVVLAGTRTATSHPDVHFDKAEREAIILENEEEATKHYSHALRKHARSEGATQPMYRINKAGTNAMMKHDA